MNNPANNSDSQPPAADNAAASTVGDHGIAGGQAEVKGREANAWFRGGRYLVYAEDADSAPPLDKRSHAVR